MKRGAADDEVEDMEVEAAEESDPYFEGYVKPSVHRVMLEDGPRM